MVLPVILEKFHPIQAGRKQRGSQKPTRIFVCAFELFIWSWSCPFASQTDQSETIAILVEVGIV